MGISMKENDGSSDWPNNVSDYSAVREAGKEPSMIDHVIDGLKENARRRDESMARAKARNTRIRPRKF
jgi:hypothetical protein